MLRLQRFAFQALVDRSQVGFIEATLHPVGDQIERGDQRSAQRQEKQAEGAHGGVHFIGALRRVAQDGQVPHFASGHILNRYAAAVVMFVANRQFHDGVGMASLGRKANRLLSRQVQCLVDDGHAGKSIPVRVTSQHAHAAFPVLAFQELLVDRQQVVGADDGLDVVQYILDFLAQLDVADQPVAVVTAAQPRAG